MSESETSLYAQMTEGMETIRKQLELLRSGPTNGGPSDDREVIAELEAELAALAQARANLGPGER
jgi:uncharacterized protein YciI